MQKVEVTSIVAYSTYGICLVWTAYVILGTLLGQSGEAILRDVGAYQERLMGNMDVWESGEWEAGDYRWYSHNCQDFCDAVIRRYRELNGPKRVWRWR